jgi:hypothetical protein
MKMQLRIPWVKSKEERENEEYEKGYSWAATILVRTNDQKLIEHRIAFQYDRFTTGALNALKDYRTERAHVVSETIKFYHDLIKENPYEVK